MVGGYDLYGVVELLQVVGGGQTGLSGANDDGRRHLGSSCHGEGMEAILHAYPVAALNSRDGPVLRIFRSWLAVVGCHGSAATGPRMVCT